MPISSSTVLDDDGNVRVSVGGQLDRWRRHLSHVLNISSSFDESVVSFMGEREVYASCPPPGAKDTHAALRAMSNGKFGSTSSIVPELLKGDGLCLRVALADWLRDVWTQSYAPHDWHHAGLVPVPEKGDLRQCDQWRGIALLDVGKVCGRIIENKLRSVVENDVLQSQCGFVLVGGVEVLYSVLIIYERTLRNTTVRYSQFSLASGRYMIRYLVRRYGLPLQISASIRTQLT